MTHVKRLTIALILELTLFYNIERLSFGESYYHYINIQSFVYGLGLIAVLGTLLVPALRRMHVGPVVALWLGAYALGKLLVFRNPTRVAFDGYNFFVTFTEIALLTLAVLIAHALARALKDFEQAVENITLNGMTRRLRQVADAAEDIETELVRSRRYHTPLSVVVVEPKEQSFRVTLNRAIEQVQKAMASRYVLTGIASLLTNVLRRTDMIPEQPDKGRFIIFSPQTDARSSQVLSRHIQSVIAERLHVSVECGVAVFPSDALTFEELVHRAESNLTDHDGNGAGPRVSATDAPVDQTVVSREE